MISDASNMCIRGASEQNINIRGSKVENRKMRMRQFEKMLKSRTKIN